MSSISAYKKISKIGRGSFGEVYKAHLQSDVDEIVAIKTIQRHKLTPRLLENLESEIAILERLRHRNVVGLNGTFKTSEHIYLVLEYCSGGDLHKYIRKRGPLGYDETKRLATELSSGLEYLWSLSLIHRDLKPQNLLLSSFDRDATLKIADFGFARHLATASLAETLCGSPLYMAPEILRHHKYDAKADLWSVGTILYEMMVGTPPFTGSSPLELLRNIERSTLKCPQQISDHPDLVDLLTKLLRKNPIERISFREFFAHPFFASTTTTTMAAEEDEIGEDDELRTIRRSFRTNSSTSSLHEKRISFSTTSSPTSPSIPSSGGATNDATRNASISPLPSLRSSKPFHSPKETSRSLKGKSRAPTLIVNGSPKTAVRLLDTKTTLKPSSPKAHADEDWLMVDEIVPAATKERRMDVAAVESGLSIEEQTTAAKRAFVFARNVGVRAIHLARLADRFVDLDLVVGNNVGSEDEKSDRRNRLQSAALLLKATEFMRIAFAAAQDSVQALRSLGPDNISTALAEELLPQAQTTLNELGEWMSACLMRIDDVLERVDDEDQDEDGGALPTPCAEKLMFDAALLLGRRAAGRETLELDNELGDSEDDYRVGLMFLELLTVVRELSDSDRRIVRGYVALFQNRINAAVTRYH